MTSPLHNPCGDCTECEGYCLQPAAKTYPGHVPPRPIPAPAQPFCDQANTPALALSYSLSRYVPDMERGFNIQTNYGDIHIEAGPEAEHIRKFLAESFQKRLTEITQGAA